MIFPRNDGSNANFYAFVDHLCQFIQKPREIAPIIRLPVDLWPTTKSQVSEAPVIDVLDVLRVISEILLQLLIRFEVVCSKLFLDYLVVFGGSYRLRKVNLS